MEKEQHNLDIILKKIKEGLSKALYLSSSNGTKPHTEEIKYINKQVQDLIASQNLTGILLPRSLKPRLLFDFPDTQHFFNLNIIQYKGLNNIRIDKLNKINIFAGENNSGKTSVLEAIRLLMAQNDANDFLALQQLRGKFPEGKLSPSWLIDNIPHQSSIEGEFGVEKSIAKVDIATYREHDGNLNSANYLESAYFEGSFKGMEYNSNLHLFEKKEDNYTISTTKGLHNLCAFAYYSPFGGYRNTQLYNAHATSIEKRHLTKVINFLKDNIDDKIVNILLVEKNGLKRFLVEHVDFDEAIDLVHFGDGLQNIFRTALLFATAENGVMLIDEMGTAIHYSLLTQYTKFIQQLAETFNTQVFITSHSDECIDAFVDNDYKNDDISMYNLEVDGGKVLCKYMSGNRFRELNELVGIDLRK